MARALNRRSLSVAIIVTLALLLLGFIVPVLPARAFSPSVTATTESGSTPGAYGIGFSPDGTQAFVTGDCTNGVVYIIDTSTFSITGSITLPTSGSTTACPVDAATSTLSGDVYVTDYSNDWVDVINPSTDSVTTTIPVGASPWGLAVTADGNYLYVVDDGCASGSDPCISVISVNPASASYDTVVDTITYSQLAGVFPSTPESLSPTYVAIASSGEFAYVSMSATVNLVELSLTGSYSEGAPYPVAQVSAGPGDSAYDPTTGGTMVGSGSAAPYELAVTTGGMVYASFDNVDDCSVSGAYVAVINGSANTLSEYITNSAYTTFDGPAGISVASTGPYVYVTNAGNTNACSPVVYADYAGYVSVISTSTNTVSDTVTVGSGPQDAAITPNGEYLYTPNGADGDVSEVQIIPAPVAVTQSNPNGWDFLVTDGTGAVAGTLPYTLGYDAFIQGPATPPFGSGSVELATAFGGGDGSVSIATSNFDGTPLSDLTSLTYWTYDLVNNGQQFPYLALDIATNVAGCNPNSQGSTNACQDILFFEPPYQTPVSTNSPTSTSCPNQGPTEMNTWQLWDALDGCWWDNNGIATPGAYEGPDSPGVQPLSTFLAQYPDATIESYSAGNSEFSAGPVQGVTLSVGYGSPTDSYVGFVQGFGISVGNTQTTYDFEPVTSVTTTSTATSTVTSPTTITQTSTSTVTGPTTTSTATSTVVSPTTTTLTSTSTVTGPTTTTTSTTTSTVTSPTTTTSTVTGPTTTTTLTSTSTVTSPTTITRTSTSTTTQTTTSRTTVTSTTTKTTVSTKTSTTTSTVTKSTTVTQTVTCVKGYPGGCYSSSPTAGPSVLPASLTAALFAGAIGSVALTRNGSLRRLKPAISRNA